MCRSAEIVGYRRVHIARKVAQQKTDSVVGPVHKNANPDAASAPEKPAHCAPDDERGDELPRIEVRDAENHRRPDDGLARLVAAQQRG